MNCKQVVLFCESGSVYKDLNCDVFDITRNALSYSPGSPVICHPPCRLWSKMKAFSSAPTSEKYLAVWSIIEIRKFGGVLEHPAGSSLWKYFNLPKPGKIDKFGGITICIDQRWFGHPAGKRTLLYIVGILPSQVPDYNLNFNAKEFIIGTLKNNRVSLPEVPKKWRNRTPIEFARFLIKICDQVRLNSASSGPIGLSYLPELKLCPFCP